MASVIVRYFAALREQRGTDREVVKLLPKETAEHLYERLFHDVQRTPVAFAINESLAAGTQELFDEDEVVFLPPVGGG